MNIGLEMMAYGNLRMLSEGEFIKAKETSLVVQFLADQVSPSRRNMIIHFSKYLSVLAHYRLNAGGGDEP